MPITIEELKKRLEVSNVFVKNTGRNITSGGGEVFEICRVEGNRAVCVEGSGVLYLYDFELEHCSYHTNSCRLSEMKDGVEYRIEGNPDKFKLEDYNLKFQGGGNGSWHISQAPFSYKDCEFIEAKRVKVKKVAKAWLVISDEGKIARLCESPPMNKNVGAQIVELSGEYEIME